MSFTTHYVFQVDVEAKEAIAQARALGKELGNAVNQAANSAKIDKLESQIKRLRTTVRNLTKEAQADGVKAAENIGAAIEQKIASSALTVIRGLGFTMGSASYAAGQNMGESMGQGMAQALTQYFSAGGMTSMLGSGTQQDVVEAAYRVIPQLTSGIGGGGGGGGGGKIDWMAYAGGGMNAFTMGVTDATKSVWALRRAMYGLETLGRSIKRSGLQMAGAMATATEKYGNFNEVITRASMAMEMPIAMEKEFEDATLSLAKTMGAFDASEIAESMRLWAAGTGAVVTSSKAMNEVLSASVDVQKLAAMNGVNLENTIDQVGAAMATFGMNTSDTTRIVAALNYVAAKSFANVDDLGSSLKMVGPVVTALGVDFNEIVATLGLLSNANIKGTMAGRALRQTFIKLSETTVGANRVLNQMTQSANDTSDAWREIIFPEGEFIGLAEYIDTLAAGMEKMTAAERSAAIATLTTANEQSALTALIEQSIAAREYGVNVIRAEQKLMEDITDSETERYKAMQEALGQNIDSATSAASLWEQMWERFEGSTQNRINKLKNSWDKFVLGMGDILADYLIPKLEDMLSHLDKLQVFLEANPWLVKAFAASAVVTIGGGSALEMVGDIGKNVANMFTLFKGMAQVLAYIAQATPIPAIAGRVISGAATGAVIPTIKTVAAFLTSAGGAAIFAGLGVGALAAFGITKVRGVLNRTELSQNAGIISTQNEQTMARFNEMFRKEHFGGSGYMSRNNEYESQTTALLTELYGDAREGLGATILESKDLAAALAILAASVGRLNDKINQKTFSGKGVTPTVTASSAGYFDMTDDEISMVEIWYKSQRAIEEADAKMLSDMAALGAAYKETQANLRDSLIEDVTGARAGFAADELASQNDLYSTLEDLQANFLKTKEDNEESYQDATLKQAEDFQRKLERMERDHRYNMIDLVESRDVRAISKEMRDYQANRADAIVDFDITGSRSAQSRRDQRADLLETYNERVADAKAASEEETENRRVALAAEIAAIKASNEAATTENNTNYKNSLNASQTYHDEVVQQAEDAAGLAMAEFTGLAEAIRQDTYPQMLIDLDEFMDEWSRTYVEAMGLAGSDGIAEFVAQGVMTAAELANGNLPLIMRELIKPKGLPSTKPEDEYQPSSAWNPMMLGDNANFPTTQSETPAVTIISQDTYTGMTTEDVGAYEKMVDRKMNNMSRTIAAALRG